MWCLRMHRIHRQILTILQAVQRGISRKELLSTCGHGDRSGGPRSDWASDHECCGSLFHRRAREGEEEKGRWPYCEAVSTLIWIIAMSRSGITSVVCDVAKHMHVLTQMHWKATLRILQHPKRTSTHRVTYKAMGEQDFNCSPTPTLPATRTTSGQSQEEL